MTGDLFIDDDIAAKMSVTSAAGWKDHRALPDTETYGDELSN